MNETQDRAPLDQKRNIQNSRTRVWITVAALVAVLVTLVILLYRGSGTKEADVMLWFDVPDTVVSGSEVDFSIIYENRSGYELSDLTLEFTQPDGFSFVESTPDSRDGSGRSFNLPGLAKGNSGRVDATGVFTGTPQATRTLKAKLFYRVSNTSSQFSAETSVDVALQAADFNLQLTGPTENVNGQEIDYTVSLQNFSNNAVEGLKVVLVPPPGFELLSEVEASASPETFEVGRLEVGGEYLLQFRGLLSGTAGERKLMRVDLSVPDSSGGASVISRTVLTTVITDAPLSARLSQSTSQAEFANEGDTVSYEVKYHNTSSRGMRNVNISVQLSGSAVDFASVRADGGALIGDRIIWNASGKPQLEIVQPGASGILTFSFKIKSNLTTTKTSNPMVVSRYAVSSLEYPQMIPGDQIELLVASKLVAQASLLHVEGPNPPVGGQQTTYRVLLSLSNAVNNLTSVDWLGFITTPTAEFIEGSVEPQSAAANVLFIPGSGRVVWNAGNLPAFGDTAVSFLVRVTPSAADTGQQIKLLKNSNITGRDTFIDKVVKPATIPELTTPAVK